MRLRNRSKQIPNGMTYYVPQTGWRPKPWSSFNVIVDTLIAHRLGNPHLAKEHGWSTDPREVEGEVDAFNARLCADNGWNDFIVQGGEQFTAPKPLAPRSILERLRNVAGGAGTLISWIKSGAEAVSPEQSNSRASVCAGCPENKSTSFGSIFTVPVSRAIHAELQKRSEWGLKTDHDEKLGVCDVCVCPLPLKVHVPRELIMKRLEKQVFDELPAHCWIKKEGQ